MEATSATSVVDILGEGGMFKPHVVRDGLLITGQNPPSSEPAAEALLEALVAEPVE